MKRFLPLILLTVVLGCIGAWTWQWRHRAPPPRPPVLDPRGVDPAVWRAVEKAQVEVERNLDSSRAWGRLGMILLAHQFRDEALVCLIRAEQLDPRDARWPYYRAMVLRRSNPKEAIDSLRRALALAPEYEEPRLFLADLLFQSGQWNEGRTLFESVLERAPNHSRAHLGLAQVAFETDDLSACLEHLTQALDDSRTRKAAHTFLAEVQQRRGDRAAAEKALREAQSLPNDEPWPDSLAEPIQMMIVGHLEVVTHASTLLQQNRADEAIPLLCQAVEDYPESSWARVLLGRAYLAIGNLDDAEAALRIAVERDPNSVEGQFYRGVVMSERKEFASAIPFFRTATRLKSDHALAWYNLGVCLKQRGENTDAIAAYRSALASRPQFAEARINLGELLAERGEREAAAEQLREALRLKPQDVRARQMLESLNRPTTPPRSK